MGAVEFLQSDYQKEENFFVVEIFQSAGFLLAHCEIATPFRSHVGLEPIVHFRRSWGCSSVKCYWRIHHRNLLQLAGIGLVAYSFVGYKLVETPGNDGHPKRWLSSKPKFVVSCDPLAYSRHSHWSWIVDSHRWFDFMNWLAPTEIVEHMSIKPQGASWDTYKNREN